MRTCAQVPRGINPTDEEINEHAEYLGIDTVNERELLWIAERCMVAPLPRGWCGLPPLPRTSPLPPRRLAMRASLCFAPLCSLPRNETRR